MPSFRVVNLARLVITQPVISGGLTLVVLHALLCGAPPVETAGYRPEP